MRTVADAAWDVRAIADKLGLGRFCVVGRSGGGPHALACAALLGDRVLSAGILVSLAPSDAKGLDWYAGMCQSNIDEYRRASSAASAALAAELTRRAEEIRADPEQMIDFLLPELTGSDLRIAKDVGIRSQLVDTYAEACRNGAYGWIDDVLAFRCSWDFDLSAVTAPVLFWHGEEDVFSPVSHTRWLAEQMPKANVEVLVQPGAAHFGAVEVLPSVLARMQDAVSQNGFHDAPSQNGFQEAVPQNGCGSSARISLRSARSVAMFG
jgi:pimeloyl-ACP methyl ester carboxylesterase